MSMASSSILDRSRPLTGARIETSIGSVNLALAQGSPPHGGADRNAAEADEFDREEGRPLTGARIETS